MASQFHNRLIGTVILVSVGIIFLPDLLTGKHVNKSAETVASVPLRPDAAPANAPVPAVVAASGAVASVSGAVSSAIPDGVVVDSGAAGDQWAVEEVGGVVTAGEAATSDPANVTAAPATKTQTKPESATTSQAKPQTPKPQTPKPATASSPVAEESKITEVAANQPSRPAALQAGQIKSFADVVNEEGGSAGSASKPVTAQPKPVTAQPKPYASASKPVTATSSGSAWVIQAGVFSSGANAQSLAGRLRAGGLAANVSTVRSGGSTLYRVTVGPDVSRARMDALVPKVSQIAGTGAKVIAYAPFG